MESEAINMQRVSTGGCGVTATSGGESGDQRVATLERMLRQEREFSAQLLERLRGLDEEVELNWRTQCKRCTCGVFTTGIADLPDEMLLRIFSYLDAITQLRLRQVSRRWNDLLQTKALSKSITVDLIQIPPLASRPQLQMLSLLLPPGPRLHIRGIPKRLLDMHIAEPREFQLLWSSQILEHLIKSRSATFTTLRHLTLSHCFLRLSWLVNRLPASLETLRLIKCAVMQPATPGIRYGLATPCSVVVQRGEVQLEGVKGIGRWRRLWELLDERVVPLDEEETERLKANLQRLPRKEALAAIFVLRAKEPLYRDFAEDIHLPAVNVATLRPSTQHELCRMLLDCSDVHFDVADSV
ncbi:uncharacterized protein LOC129594059 [Paramacrobiotus metropolitanus]|uniref:uncharacterized protein LOC129594059 n=1 Tax=Paramacrobiotus metropolitanus TaxID=2943436 RepID=UPI0024456D61|nr:uncharacterized protein LOC129594059 [Paramacrobiotus metropolitanus]